MVVVVLQLRLVRSGLLFHLLRPDGQVSEEEMNKFYFFFYDVDDDVYGST